MPVLHSTPVLVHTRISIQVKQVNIQGFIKTIHLTYSITAQWFQWSTVQHPSSLASYQVLESWPRFFQVQTPASPEDTRTNLSQILHQDAFNLMVILANLLHATVFFFWESTIFSQLHSKLPGTQQEGEGSLVSLWPRDSSQALWNGHPTAGISSP